MVRFVLKLIGFAVLVGVPTWWLYDFWQTTASMPQEDVYLPWVPQNVYLSLPEGILVGIGFGLLLGFILVFVLFGGARRSSRQKLRRQAEQLRRQLSEAEAEVQVLKELRECRAPVSAPSPSEPLKLAPTDAGVGEEKSEPTG